MKEDVIFARTIGYVFACQPFWRTSFL